MCGIACRRWRTRSKASCRRSCAPAIPSPASRSPASAPTRPTSASGSPTGIRIATRDGEIVGVNVAAEEITERKRAEAALRASERQFHTLADSIPQLVWMARRRRRDLLVQQSLVRIHGQARRRDQPACLAGGAWRIAGSRRLATGSALEAELSLLGKDGEYRPFLTRVVPLRDPAWRGLWLDRHSYRHRRAQAQRTGDAQGQGCRGSRVAKSARDPELADRGGKARGARAAGRGRRARGQQSRRHQPDGRLLAGAQDATVRRRSRRGERCGAPA